MKKHVKNVNFDPLGGYPLLAYFGDFRKFGLYHSDHNLGQKRCFWPFFLLRATLIFFCGKAKISYF